LILGCPSRFVQYALDALADILLVSSPLSLDPWYALTERDSRVRMATLNRRLDAPVFIMARFSPSSMCSLAANNTLFLELDVGFCEREKKIRPRRFVERFYSNDNDLTSCTTFFSRLAIGQ
jgi:hypothetical protein